MRTISKSSISDVLLFPVSGYANRFQAMASSNVLAETLGARLRICWEPQDILPAQANEVFSPGFCDEFIISPNQARAEFGVTRPEIPYYLQRDRGSGVISLAGHDRGEQAFMTDLQRMLLESSHDLGPRASTIVIAAGGQFVLPDSATTGIDPGPDFRDRRRSFYTRMRFRDEIEDAVTEQLEGRPSFMGLHLRYSDRAHQAPHARSIRRAITSCAEASGLTSCFIASDTASARDLWLTEVRRLGLEPWFVSHDSLVRTHSGGSRAALVDWRVLAHTQRLVYFAESTFAVEAAVAGRGFDDSIGLAASRSRTAAVRGRDLLRAAVTYPKRHGWVR